LIMFLFERRPSAVIAALLLAWAFARFL